MNENCTVFTAASNEQNGSCMQLLRVWTIYTYTCVCVCAVNANVFRVPCCLTKCNAHVFHRWLHFVLYNVWEKYATKFEYTSICTIACARVHSVTLSNRFSFLYFENKNTIFHRMMAFFTNQTTLSFHQSFYRWVDAILHR